MNIFLMLAIVVANAIALALIYQFIKKLPKTDILMFIAISIAIVYSSISIAYWISGFGMDKELNDAAKDTITFLFVPVNTILLIPFVANKYRKFRLKEIKKREFVATIIKITLVGLIILIIECFYFKSMKANIKAINENIEKNKNKNTTEYHKNQETNQITNDIVNDVVNDTVNEITNEINNKNTNRVTNTTNTNSINTNSISNTTSKNNTVNNTISNTTETNTNKLN